jgi:excisionase family DNA binding protein
MTTRGDTELLKTDELAEWLRLSRWTVYRDYERLGIPHVRIGGSLRFSVKAVREWLEQQQQSDAGNAA